MSAAEPTLDTHAARPLATHSLAGESGPETRSHRGRLFRKYLLLILSLVTVVLLVSSGINLYFSYRENRAALSSLQHEKALAAASRIEQYIRQVSQQLAYTSLPQLDAADMEARRIEFLKLLRQAPEVTDIAQLDAAGRERIAVSRLGMDVVASGRDRSSEPAFQQARRGQPWYGPVYFRKETEPYMTVAIRTGVDNGPVTVAEVNLKFIWDVVSRIKIGIKGKAYVVDAGGLLVADPDIGLVLRKTNLAELPHVKAAVGTEDDPSMTSRDLAGTPVLTSMAPIDPLAWKVFVEQPIAEVYEKLNASIARTGALLLAGLVISALAASALARGMVQPIRTLDEGAQRIGAGELDQRIVVRTGDELEGLADQFNRMSAQLSESYAGLERKVEQRTAEVTEALEYQTAISEVLRVISSSTTDVTPVFEAIMESAVRLFAAPIAAAFRYDGRLVYLVGTRGWSAAAIDDSRRMYPGPPNPRMLSGRIILAGVARTEEDVRADPDYDPTTAQVGQWRRMIGAPMLKDGAVLGVVVIAWPDPGKTPQRQVDLLQTFADQAVIAIENVRLINETKEALEQQTATAGILRVISSSVSDTKPVFDAILASCERLFDGQHMGINLVGADGLVHLAAHRGPTPDRDAFESTFPVPLTRESGSGSAILDRGVMHYPDVEAYGVPLYVQRSSRAVATRSVIIAPLLWEGRGIGAIFVGRGLVGPFSDKDIALLRTFADQAVIAIQNARLFNETKDALEQQTATSEVLKTISRTTFDLQPVLATLIESASRLCKADKGFVYLREGDTYRMKVSYRVDPHSIDPRPLPAEPGTLVGRVAITREIVHIEDALSDPDYTWRAAQERLGYRTMLGVPMLREGEPIGVVAMWRDEVRPFSERDIRVVTTFADQAVIALENVRLLNETQEALERQIATADILRVIAGSPSDVQPVLDAIVRSAAQLFGRRAAIRLAEGDVLRRNAISNVIAGGFDGEESLPIDRQSLVGAVVLERKALQVEDTHAPTAPPYARMNAGRLNYRAIASAPLMREGAVLGVISVSSATPGELSEKQLALLATFADQAVIAIENARLFHEIEDKSRQLEVANRHKSEFLANMSHELRTPLNAIIGFSEVLTEQMFGEVNDKQLEYLQDIHSSGQHLLTLINDVLDLSKIEAGRMELELSCFDLGLLLDNSMTLVRERAQRQGLKLTLEVGEDLEEWVADARKVKQVVVNLLSNAVKFTPTGGSVTLLARRADSGNDQFAQISVADTGVGIAPEEQAMVFEEFRQASGDYLRKTEGTGLGLSLAKRFVELHGGTIRIDSERGQGATFMVELPLLILEAIS